MLNTKIGDKTSICVFCGASNDIDKKFLEIGAQFGKMLALRGVDLVYGGGDRGVMGAVSGATMTAGGRAIGVFPRSLRNVENDPELLTEIVLVDTMHERKQHMFERSDAFVVFPGGLGTLDETFEIITWKQLLLHEKPVIIFNYEGYWDSLIALIKNIIEQKFAKAEIATYYHVVTELEQIFDMLDG
jgi:uncharacterized protein (TIGR00730 family)